MKKTLLALTLGATVLSGYSATPIFKPNSPFFSIAKAQSEGELEKSSSWGILNTPSGEEWMYTADYTYADDWGYNISSVHFTIYDGSMKEYSQFDVEFTLGENETSVNFVQIAPTLTKKFFNYDDAYEVMVFAHATTTDYTGHCYTMAYSLKDGAKLFTIEGNQISAVNTAQDEWSENFTIAFTRESYENGYEIFVDVYTKPSWGDNGPKLAHTFAIDSKRFQGAAGAASYFLMSARNGKDIFYVTPYYEKPFWASDDYEDETVNPDNNFVIDLYDSSFNLVKTTKIPMATKAGYLWSFPGMGILMGDDDLDFKYFSTGEDPAYIVGIENYSTSTDDFYFIDYLVYDVEGNLLKTITEDAEDCMRLYDIPGHERQYCFYTSQNEESIFTMVDIPSCTQRARINTTLPDGESITTSFDRAPVGNSYMYVSSYSMADVDNQGNALHKMAWFNPDGTLARTDVINLGENISLAVPYVSGLAFDPYIFNTDSDIEYMFLVKQLRDNEGSTADTYLRIYGKDNNLIFNLGPDLEKGEYIASVFLHNLGSTNARLVVAFNSETGFSVKYYGLPLTKFAGGEGTAENPYLISSTGDFMAIATEPSANFKVINDIDFAGADFITNSGDFIGVLDGNGCTLSNAQFNEGGIFASLTNSALVKDLNIVNCFMNATESAGFISAYSYGYTASTHPTISNVNVSHSSINGGENYYGGILGTSYTFTTISECAVEQCQIMTEGIAGGIVGRMQTSSKVLSCAFSGDVVGNIAGGIAGDSHTGDETISNCHTSGSVEGFTVAGGIIGESSRSIITNCYVETDLYAMGSEKAYAGGIVGELECTYADNPPVIISNNIVGDITIVVLEDAENVTAHRIIGRSAGDEFEYDYDEDGLPYVIGNKDPEVSMKNNYAYKLGIIDTEVADAHDSLEGQTIEELSQAFMEGLGFGFGETEAAPWTMIGDDYCLYIEKDNPAGIGSITTDCKSGDISFDGITLQAEGTIKVFTLTGAQVTAGYERLEASTLPRGIYIAVSDKGALKFSVK